MYLESKDKVAAVFSYLGWLFWLIALIMRNKDDALLHHHMNQGLVLAIAQTIASLMTRADGILGYVGSVCGLVVLVLTIMGSVRAVKGSDEPLPVIENFKLF